MTLEPENLPDDLPDTGNLPVLPELEIMRRRTNQGAWDITHSYGRREGVIKGNGFRFFYYAYSGSGRD